MPMAFTIAPIAVKPATFPWLAVATEPMSLHMQIDADARLAAAAGGVARYLADASGLENSSLAQLQSAIIAACDEAFGHLTKESPHLEITFTRFSDRIEVALRHHGDASPAVGRDAIAGFRGQVAGARSVAGIFAGVDRVQYEKHGEDAVTRLTKYIGQVAPTLRDSRK